MSGLKIRIELNKGRKGMPLEKLVVRVENLAQFLNSVVSDLRLKDGCAVWSAEEFSNGSVDFDCCLLGEIEEAEANQARSVLDSFFGNRPLDPIISLKVGAGTRSHFRRLTRSLDPDELIRVSLYEPGNGELGPWLLVGAGDSTVLDAEPRFGRTYFGEVQGTVSALFKEGKMHLWIREISTDRRVKCIFREDLYPDAVRALNDQDAVVFIEGQVKEDPDTGETVEISAEHIRPAPPWSQDLYQSLLGAIPGYTDPLTTLEHAEAFRAR